MNHKGTVTLETERLILRRFIMNDVTDAYNNWLSDPDVAMYMQWDAHTNIKQTQEWIAKYYVGNYEKNDYYRWAIALKEDNRVIGSVGFNIEREYDSVADVSYALCKRLWNKGIMSEALTAVIAYALKEVKINRLEAFHAVANPGSGKVLQKAGMKFEGHARQKYRNRLRGFEDCDMYAILAEDYFSNAQKNDESAPSNVATLKTSTELMFFNFHIAMDTIDWNANVCGAPAWRYIYHTLHSADKFFINPSSWIAEDEPPFHSHMLDWPDTQADTVLSKETLYDYFDKVRQKIISYIDNLNDVQLNDRPGGKLTRLGLILSQFRHMYAHIGILNGVTIANTQQYPRVINESVWCSGRLPEGLYDVEERK